MLLLDVNNQLDPAQRGNLCAIKPTVGLVSRHLVIPISETHDTVNLDTFAFTLNYGSSLTETASRYSLGLWLATVILQPPY